MTTPPTATKKQTISIKKIVKDMLKQKKAIPPRNVLSFPHSSQPTPPTTIYITVEAVGN